MQSSLYTVYNGVITLTMLYHISGLVTRLRQPPSFGGAPVAAFGHGMYRSTQAITYHCLLTIERTSIKIKGWNPLQCTRLPFYH